MWFRMASVVLEMFHLVSCGRLEMFHVVSCGQRGRRDVSCGFLWPAWYSTCSFGFVWPAWCSRCYRCCMCGFVWPALVLELHVVSCGQRGARDVSCGFVWPVWYSRCFMWFRMASVVLEIVHVVSRGQRATRVVRCARCQGGTRIAGHELASPERSRDVVDTSISRNYHSVE